MTLNNGMLCFAPARGNDGKVDIDATTIAARKAAEEFAANDDPLTAKIGEAAIKVWEEKQYSGLCRITTNALARMALNALGIIPDDKACKDAASRVDAVLSGQPDKFLIVKTGQNKGIYYRERHTAAELQLLLTEMQK
jgi:hypothetical protein